MIKRFASLSLFCAASLSATAQISGPLRFYATPYRVNEGDAVQFTYLETTNTYPKSAIKSWKWDFNNDGTFDATSTTSTNISATWTATYDATKATNNTQFVLPVLQVTLTNNTTLSVTGITETTTFTPARDKFLLIAAKATGNPDLTINFTATPRMTTMGVPVRFFADITLLKTGKVESVSWNFGDGTTGTGSSVQKTYAALGTNTVVMTVQYQLVNTAGTAYTGVTNTISRTNGAFITVVPSVGNLSLGRAYRRGFPSEYGWEDIIKAYGTPSATGDTYSYYRYLETAHSDFTFQANPSTTTNLTLGRQYLAETINELLQGQTLVANQRLIEALRIKYPRIDNLDPANPPPKLPEPPGAREETLAIDVSLLDYQSALYWAFKSVSDFGLDILRPRAPAGTEPFPDFPAYLTFADVTLSPQPVPIKNEYWQLTWALDRLAFGTVAKANKLFNLSLADVSARAESKEACKKAGIVGYLGMAVLASGQSTNDFALNQGNSLLAHVKNARDLFENINAGLNPLRNNGEFIPNESFGNIYAAAQEAVGDARSAEIEMRQEKREFDRRKAELRSELQSQRAQFITPLKNLTGLDPAGYNNLATVADQIDYRGTVNQRVNALLAAYPNADPKGLGEYGAQVIAVLDAGEAIKQSINRLNNLNEAIKISQWANEEIELVNEQATRKLKANDIARGYANSVSFNQGIAISSAGVAFTGGGISISPGSIISGYLNAEDRDTQRLQQARIANTQLQEQILKSLLEVANLTIDIRRAKNHLDQEKLKLDSMLSLMDRYIEDLAHARLTAENLYFQDPSFRVVVSSAQRRADGELDFAIDRLFRLAKTLEYEWTEPYQNPVTVPIGSQEPPSLENPLFDKFTSLESLFVVRSADESKDYLDALRAWNSKLRRITVASVRGPNHAGPITAEPISVRENILNLKTTGVGAMTLDKSVSAFRDYLRTHLKTNVFNTANKSLEFTFATTIADNSMFPATGSRWNMRIATVQIDLLADSGFNTKQVAEIDLIESGMASLRRYFAEPPFADDLFNLTFNIGTRADRTAFGIVIPAKINGATGGRPPAEFTVTGLADRPIAATRWVLKLDTENPSNRDVDFSKLKDIVIRFTYTYGNPPEFPNF